MARRRLRPERGRAHSAARYRDDEVVVTVSGRVPESSVPRKWWVERERPCHTTVVENGEGDGVAERPVFLCVPSQITLADSSCEGKARTMGNPAVRSHWRAITLQACARQGNSFVVPEAR